MAAVVAVAAVVAAAVAVVAAIIVFFAAAVCRASAHNTAIIRGFKSYLYRAMGLLVASVFFGKKLLTRLGVSENKCRWKILGV